MYLLTLIFYRLIMNCFSALALQVCYMGLEYWLAGIGLLLYFVYCKTNFALLYNGYRVPHPSHPPLTVVANPQPLRVCVFLTNAIWQLVRSPFNLRAPYVLYVHCCINSYQRGERANQINNFVHKLSILSPCIYWYWAISWTSAACVRSGYIRYSPINYQLATGRDNQPMPIPSK